MKAAVKLHLVILVLFVIAVIVSMASRGGRTALAQAGCAPPPAGLVSFWPGDASANDFQGTNHGTLVNGATFAAGRVGPAFSFDGTDDFVNVSSTINLGSSFSIEFWMFPTRAAGFEHLVSNGFASSNYGALYFLNDHLEYWQNGGLRAATPGASVSLNAWAHVALVYNGNMAQLYLNGSPSGSPSVAHPETFNNPLRLGYAVIPASGESTFQGRLDEISLYSAALSATEVQSIFTAGSAGKCVAPALLINDAAVSEGNSGTANMNFTVTLLRSTVAAMVDYATADGTATQPSDYTATSGTLTVPASGTATVTVLVNGDTALEQNETFLVNLSNPVNAVIADGQGIGTIFSDDCVAAPLGLADWYKAEGNANDSAGNHHGTLENGATLATGNTGQAFSFDGVNDYVNISSTINLGSAFTIELWIYPTSSVNYQNLVANSYPSANFGTFYFHSNHVEYWQGGAQRAVSPAVIPLNAWTHVALSYDGAVNRLYVNGVASGSPSATHAESFNNPVRFGYSVSGQDQYFQGRLDEISLYNRALSDAEIQTIYGAGGGGKCGSTGNNWTGAVSSDWHTAGNWSQGILPTAATDVVIPAVGVTNEPVISSADVTVNSLNVAANRTLTVGAGRALTVNNDLINNAALAGAGAINAPGNTTVNSGTISVANFSFNRAGAQTLSGSGSFQANTATVTSGATLTLSSDHQFSSLVIQGGAALNITSRTLSLSGSLTNNAGTFTVTDSTVVANGTTPQTLTGANFRNLTANNPAGVSLGSDTNVSHALTLTSDLQTGAFVLTMPYSTESSAGGGDVVGNIRITGLGFAAATYGNPQNRISFAAGTPPTEITVNLVKAAPPSFSNAVRRTYTITPNGGSNYSAAVRLHYLDSELNGHNESTLQLWRRDGTTWGAQGATTRDTADNWVEKTGVTSFSPWTFSPSGPTVACAVSLSPASASMPAGGGDGNLLVQAPGGCPWTAFSHTPWITITGGLNGQGNGAVSYSVAPNAGANSRTGTLTVENQTFTISQSGTCSFSLSATKQSFTPLGGAGRVQVTAGESCQWTATTEANFLSFSPGGGSGQGVIDLTVVPNPNPVARRGAILMAGQGFTVLQGARFNDVPTSHPFFEEISQLSANGITSGCGNGNFCPESSTTRGQMAVFLIKTLGVTPTSPATPRFSDVPASHPFYAFIEEMAARKITSGCGGGRYCPDDPVTRGQMAVFLIKALGITPTAPATPRFGDVLREHPFYAFIEELAASGITKGCGAGNYCPESAVTRGQMAAFLVRAFGW